MALTNSSLNRSPDHQEAVDPFAMQLALSTVHARLVPMRRSKLGYELDPSTADWFELPVGRGFAGYGLGRALRMLLDVLRGLTALHDTFDATGETFAHGDVALPQLRIDPDGVCRLVPLTVRHSLQLASTPTQDALGYLAPERLLGEAVDVRSDVFSAGALLWEALAGRRLFEETTGAAIINRLLGEKLQMPQLPPELAWGIPLKAVAARALSVDPHQRFADCAELATAIAIVARERVASHAEIATFFGAPQRSVDRRALESVHPGPDESVLSALFIGASDPRPPDTERSSVSPLPSQHPIPTRSSTFRAVGAPSSGRISTLAPLGPARSLTPPPSMRATPVPSSPPSSRSAPHLSPFSALLSAESRPELSPQSRPPSSEPASAQRSSTVMMPGTPLSALTPPLEPEPDLSEAPRSSKRPPPLPLPTWTPVPSVPVQLGGSSKPEPAGTAPLAAPLALLTLDREPQSQSASTRRAWAIALLIAIVIAIAILAFAAARDTARAVTARPIIANPTLPAATAQPLATSTGTRRPGIPDLTRAPSDDVLAPIGATPPTPTTRAPAKAPKVGARAKDYGI